MTEKTSEILDTYDELERAIYWCIPEDNAAIKAECGGWVVEITPKDRKNYKLRRAFDLATQGLELRYLLDRLRDLDGMRAFNESYYDGGWWKVAIRHKDASTAKPQGADRVAEYFAKLYGMNEKWCNLTVESETTCLTIEGAEGGERNQTLIVDDPRDKIWDEAEELAAIGAIFQGTVKGDLDCEVKYTLKPVKTWLRQPSVTVRDKRKITDYEGRAAQVTEFPAMTVITLWKEIEYK